LADKTIIVGFIPALMVAFIVMPYFEVGKSRRYADRRVGLSVSMLFIAFMLVSNWMGTPEFRVESSPDREVSIQVLPEEGPSLLMAVPYVELKPGSYLPGQVVSGSPHLTEALDNYRTVLEDHSCTMGNPALADFHAQPCKVETKADGENRYGVGINNKEAMPDPYSELRVEEVQEGLLELNLYYEVANPDNLSEILNVSDDWVKHKHIDSNYAEECRYANKC
jgi:hypothetical protein